MDKKNAKHYKIGEVMAQIVWVAADTQTMKDLLLILVKHGIKDLAVNGPWLLTTYENETWFNLFLSNNVIGFQWHIIDDKLQFKGVFDSTFALSNDKLTKQMKRNLAK